MRQTQSKLAAHICLGVCMCVYMSAVSRTGFGGVHGFFFRIIRAVLMLNLCVRLFPLAFCSKPFLRPQENFSWLPAYDDTIIHSIRS